MSPALVDAWERKVLRLFDIYDRAWVEYVSLPPLAAYRAGLKIEWAARQIRALFDIRDAAIARRPAGVTGAGMPSRTGSRP